MSKPRRFEGYVALDDRGLLVWGSFRTNEADCRYWYDNHAPIPEGKAGTIKQVEIKVFD